MTASTTGDGSFLLETLLPLCGTVTATMIALSPWQSVQAVLRSRSLDQHNPLPYPMILNNSLAWLLYSLLVRNYFVFWSNVMGWCLGLYFSLSMYALLVMADSSAPSPSHGTPSPTTGNASMMRRWMLGLLLGGSMFVLLGGLLSFLVFADPSGSSPTVRQKDVMGTVAIVVLILFYGSPLSTLRQVIRSGDASSFQWSMCVTCLVNAVFWFVYGTVIGDNYVSGPNLVGILVSLVQIACKVRFGGGMGGYYSVAGSPLHSWKRTTSPMPSNPT